MFNAEIWFCQFSTTPDLRSKISNYFSGELSGGGYNSRKIVQAKVSGRFNLGKDVKMWELWLEGTCAQLLDCCLKELFLKKYDSTLSIFII